MTVTGAVVLVASAFCSFHTKRKNVPGVEFWKMA